jgi:hypothetical protein
MLQGCQHKVATILLCQACNSPLHAWYNKINYNTSLTTTIQVWQDLYYSTVQYSTVQYSTVQYSAVQYKSCQNNLATSLIISTRLLQVVPNLLTTCDKQCEYILLTVCWLVTRCEIFTCVGMSKGRIFTWWRTWFFFVIRRSITYCFPLALLRRRHPNFVTLTWYALNQ